jgi:adenylate cyclase
MPVLGSSLRAFGRELRRRRVIQVAISYAVVAFIVIQVAAVLFPGLRLPEWTFTLVVALTLLGFPVAVVLAWSLGNVRGRVEAESETGARPPAGQPMTGDERSPGGVASAPAEPETPPAPGSVAVLPFVNTSPDSADEHLSDGLTDELIHALSRVEGLHVVSRTSVFALRGKDLDVTEIGRRLRVGAVLEGSLQRQGDRLRITAQLVSCKDGYHLWSERFDRRMEDVFAIEDEIAASIVRTLRGVLTDADRRALEKPRTDKVGAYDLYLRGRQYFHATRRKSLGYAREMFRRALEVDPDYALAWTGLADACSLLRMYYPYDPTVEDASECAEAASRRALELDPELPEAHAARGFALCQQGKLSEAIPEFERAIELDPRQFEARYFQGRARFQAGQIEEAARLFGEALEVREDYQAAFFKAQALAALGRDAEAGPAYQRALEIVDRHLEMNPDDPRAATVRAVALYRTGHPAEGLAAAERALAVDSEDLGVRYNVACLYSLEGETERALDLLEQVAKRGFGAREWYAHDPDLDPIRDDPRFARIMEADGAATSAREGGSISGA